MANSDEIRWQQRLSNFEKAMSTLGQAAGQSSFTILERAGLIKMFEFSFELCWKTLKDLLFYEGFDSRSPREVLRLAFSAGHLNEDQCETLLDALDKRNLLSHTYDQEMATEAVRLITTSYAPALGAVLHHLQKRRVSS